MRLLAGSGGSYFIPNAAGDKVAVLKPADEEPFSANNPRHMGSSPDGHGLRKVQGLQWHSFRSASQLSIVTGKISCFEAVSSNVSQHCGSIPASPKLLSVLSKLLAMYLI